jgi:hypothetical protein
MLLAKIRLAEIQLAKILLASYCLQVTACKDTNMLAEILLAKCCLQKFAKISLARTPFSKILLAKLPFAKIADGLLLKTLFSKDSVCKDTTRKSSCLQSYGLQR